MIKTLIDSLKIVLRRTELMVIIPPQLIERIRKAIHGDSSCYYSDEEENRKKSIEEEQKQREKERQEEEKQRKEKEEQDKDKEERRAIRRDYDKQVEKGIATCNICHQTLDTDYSLFINYDRTIHNAFCKDCVKDFSYDIRFSSLMAHSFINLASFSKNIESRLLKRISELENRIKELEK